VELGQEELSRALNRQPITRRAKNVILFVGDGMGVSTVTAARIFQGQRQNKTGEEGLLFFERFPNIAHAKVRRNIIIQIQSQIKVIIIRVNVCNLAQLRIGAVW
jgi:alkaline phosphatase